MSKHISGSNNHCTTDQQEKVIFILFMFNSDRNQYPRISMFAENYSISFQIMADFEDTMKNRTIQMTPDPWDGSQGVKRKKSKSKENMSNINTMISEELR